MTKTSRKLITAISVLLISTLSVKSQVYNDNDETLGLSYEQNLLTPVVPDKASAQVVRHMDNIGKTLTKHDFEVKKARKGEVLDIVMPVSILFTPGDTILRSAALPVLRAFDALIRRPELYKVIIVAHTDNTGDELYSKRLSIARAKSVERFLESLVSGIKTNIISYGLGYDKALVPNNSIVNRARNRRIDIYIVPGVALVDLARKGKLS